MKNPILPLAAVVALSAFAFAQPKSYCESTSDVGYSDTPQIPKQNWHVHDIKRPHPPMVNAPAAQNFSVPPPSDAIVLFDGKDLSKWQQQGRGAERGKFVAPKWKVENGYFEIVPKTGDLITKEGFGDAQYHVEWASPAKPCGGSQLRGNSGFILMSRYEIQVLDSWDNLTYADGQAAAIYGQWPPMVNASRKPGEWQSYDIAFEAPRFENGKLVKPPYVTVFHNGVLVHHHQEITGPMAHKVNRPFEAHGLEAPLLLQDHDTPVRYRNIWVRKLKGYDQK
jgi:hypothetical protein